jgi:NitT/TauT family transport system ATP-binding protein
MQADRRPPAVDVQALSLSFDGVRNVLDGVSLQVAAGEFVALIGPSGCGKTTLLNLCAGLVPAPPQGTIRVCGEAVQLGNRRTAYMLARDSLLPWATAEANAAFGLKLTGRSPAECRDAARAMLARVGLAGFEQAYPKALSHGMRQRVALARTFALDADLLLMDEPFGALDAQTKLQLQDLLLQLCQESRRSVVFVTHDLSEAVAVADRVVVMSSRPGRLVADIAVDLPRPRSIRALQKDHRFHALYAQLWQHLERGWSQHEG